MQMSKNVFLRFRENAVIRFWYSHMLVIILCMAVCLIGFYRAFDIVRDSIIEEKTQLMQQSIQETDKILSEIYTSGLKITQSAELRSLERYENQRSGGYYTAARAFVDEFNENLRYYDYTLYDDAFLYIHSMDRYVYDSAFYRKEIFSMYMKRWELDDAVLNHLFSEAHKTPFLYRSPSGALFYVFPATRSINDSSTIATLVFRIRGEKLKGTILNHSDRASLFVTLDGQTVFSEDELNLKDPSGLTGHKEISVINGKTVDRSRLDWKALLSIAEKHEIASHSFQHPDLTTIGTPAAMHEIIADRECLERNTDRFVIGFAWPYGTYDDPVLEILRLAGFTYARTTRDSFSFLLPDDFLRWDPTCHYTKALAGDLAERFCEHPDPRDRVFLIWGHAYD